MTLTVLDLSSVFKQMNRWLKQRSFQLLINVNFCEWHAENNKCFTTIYLKHADSCNVLSSHSIRVKVRKMKSFEHREAVKLLSCLLNFEKELGFDLKEHLENCSEFAQRLREEAPIIKKRNRDVGKKYILFIARWQFILAITNTATSAAGIASGVTAIVGFALAPVTFGASTVLLIGKVV